jgi:hypothetical protein
MYIYIYIYISEGEATNVIMERSGMFHSSYLTSIPALSSPSHQQSQIFFIFFNPIITLIPQGLATPALVLAVVQNQKWWKVEV